MSKALQSLIDISHNTSLPFAGDFHVDDNVLAKFPEGTTIVSAHHFGTSAWTVTARLHLKLPHGPEERYFLKSAPEEHGRTLMEGEFNAMTELHKWASDLVPKPHSWGKYAVENPEAYFFLSQYIEMSDRMPDPSQLCTKLARLHRQSQSPTGHFGFHVTTCQGRVPQSVSWEPSWTAFFIKLLKHVIDMDFRLNGYWKDLDTLEKRLIEHVIPRLLNALVEDGRTIKPSLIHADLWEGNTGTAFDNGNIYIFDSAAFYAHHEMEVGNWRCFYNNISKRLYTRTYLQHNGPSEPEDDIYYNTIYSANHLSQGKAVRQLAYSDMYYLIDKYAPFPEGEGPPKLEKSEMASLSAERDHTMDATALSVAMAV
ncbi:Fructosamine kinase-domain-containing protein [Diplogelasinospora grovesii]|uniref:protein-ribulosamine 3-kinase n=1 Tax=Diplogelasinospora grovesii TaxID=303347 RepID=A0AAN6MVQ7_9PEZI|nr:Fructosamine kinase-domain-containing protein [Diplogelasinospora grovesii]